MPRCPKCGKEIYYLRDFSPVWQEFILGLDEYNRPRYDFVDASLGMDIADEFRCPECGEVLFRDADKAIEFLKGTKD